MMNKMASIQICSPVTTNGRCQKAHSTPRIRLAMSAEYRNCSRGRAYPLKPGSSHVPARPGIKSDNKNSSKKLDQPPKSATEDVRCAPSKKTLSAAAARMTTIGSRSATAYHWSPTRQRTIRRSNAVTGYLLTSDMRPFPYVWANVTGPIVVGSRILAGPRGRGQVGPHQRLPGWWSWSEAAEVRWGRHSLGWL